MTFNTMHGIEPLKTHFNQISLGLFLRTFLYNIYKATLKKLLLNFRVYKTCTVHVTMQNHGDIFIFLLNKTQINLITMPCGTMNSIIKIPTDCSVSLNTR